MEQSIKNVEAIVNIALQRGAFRNIQEATEAINVVAQLRVEWADWNNQNKENIATLQKRIEEYAGENFRLKNQSKKSPNPIPKQSELKKVADKKEK